MLEEFLATRATELGVPGAAAGVVVDGKENYAYHGVTNVENPLPVNQNTLFHIGSITKTYTATALMVLVERGEVDLAAPVIRYVPELRLADESAAQSVTISHLLTHTAGWSDFERYDTGEGDDALSLLVAQMTELTQVSPPGTRVVYNNGAFSLAGRVIEKVTGTTYEHAVRTLLLEPLGLRQSFLLPHEVMTRRFAVGHNTHPDGAVTLADPWKAPRSANPPGGITSTIADQLAWARFHLGDGTARDGQRVLSEGLLTSMQEPIVTLFGAGSDDAIGISWMLRDIEGTRTVGHAGGMTSQYSQLLMVPERKFAVMVVGNSSPSGVELTVDVMRWALSTFLGLVDRDPEPIPFDSARAREIIGTYEIDTVRLTISATDSEMWLAMEVKRTQADVDPPEIPRATLGLLPGTDEEYILTGGAFKGMRGIFARGADGSIVGLEFNGRPYSRVTA